MRKIFLIILVAISFISIADLLHPGLPITHDGKDHIARIANFYLNLQQGILIPRWAPNLNWGYGHPILEFLYPLPSYLASYFHMLGFSFIDSAKFVFGLSMIASGVIMYLWLAEFLPVAPAFVGGVLYMFTPYRFVELYVRGDIGEHLAFMFMPLTLLCAYRMFKTRKLRYLFLGAISLASLILAHNAISLMYLPFIIFYFLYLAMQQKKKIHILIFCCLFVLLGFGLAAFFWIPGLFEAKYTLRNVVTVGEYASRFVSFSQLIYGPWSYNGSGAFTVQLGIINWVMVFGSLIPLWLFWKKKNFQYVFLGTLLLYTLIAIFLMLPLSDPIWHRILLLQNFQFPWRFLAIPVFTTSVLAAFTLSVIPEKYCIRASLCAVGLMLIYNNQYWHANGYLQKPDTFFTAVYDGTTDTGESSPIWSIRFMEHRFTQPLEVISGQAQITIFKRTPTKHIYLVSSNREIQLRENTLYFPGWKVRVDNSLADIQYQDPKNRGLLTFRVPKGKHILTISYSETKLRLFSDMISLMTLLGILVVSSISYMTNVSNLRYNKD